MCRHGQKCPSPNSWNRGICYVTCHEEILVADGIRVSNLLTLNGEIVTDFPGSPCHHTVLTRGKQKGQSLRHRRDAEAEVGVPWPHTEDCRQPPEVGKGK